MFCVKYEKKERISAETNENLFQFHFFTGFPLLTAFFFTFSFWMLMMIAIRERTRAIVLRIKHVNVMQSIWGEGWGLVNYILFMKTKQKKKRYNGNKLSMTVWRDRENEKRKFLYIFEFCCCHRRQHRWTNWIDIGEIRMPWIRMIQLT